ncbi:hypothetical protein CVT24_013196 [Panaeolus cyanescens]|uniref:Uncharacterized protein n=1 Tax=Panaeolus cyanescens TaxID=181874 RepID=A0A409YMV6_9AGAR|nr:hypothetical protein CVT24_013196 [Panaeolus cyanescens]
MSTLTPNKFGTPKKEYWKAKKNDIIIAVIGRTGAGKTSFIGHARNDPTLRTSKHDVPRGYRLHGHPRFGERIVLVDTPGFDGNQPVEDEKVVKRIQEWYKNNYKASLLAGGILYLHNINDTRTEAASPADWVHLSRLFGPSGAVVGRLVVVMSHWHDADGNEALLNQFNERKEELAEKWKTLIGAEPKRIAFYDTPESVQEALELLLSDEAVTAPAAARSTSPSPESKSQPRTPRPDSPPLVVPQPVHVQPAAIEPPQPVVEPTPAPPAVVDVPAVKPAEPIPEPVAAPVVPEEKPVETAPVVAEEPAPVVAEEPTPAPEPVPVPEVKAEAPAPVEETKVEEPVVPSPPAPVVAEPPEAEESTPAPAPAVVPEPVAEPVAEPTPEPPVAAEEPALEPVSVRLVTAEPLPPVEVPVIPSVNAEPAVDAAPVAAPSAANDDAPTPAAPEETPATQPAASSDEAPKEEAAATSPEPAPATDAAVEKTATPASEPAAAVAVPAPKDDTDSKSVDNRPSTIKVEQPAEKKVDEQEPVNEKQGSDEKADEKTTSTVTKGAPSEALEAPEKIKISWWRKLCCGCF